MNNINIGLVRLFQFVVFVFFTFTVLVYFGAMILVPLDLLLLIIKVLGVVGLSELVGVGVAIPVVGYLGMLAYKTPGLVDIILHTGIELVDNGKQRVAAFNAIANRIKK